MSTPNTSGTKPKCPNLRKLLNDAIASEKQQQLKVNAAFKNFNSDALKMAAVSSNLNHREIRIKLNRGEWPEKILGPSNDLSKGSFLGVGGHEVFIHAKYFFDSLNELEDKRAAIRKAQEALNDCIIGKRDDEAKPDNPDDNQQTKKPEKPHSHLCQVACRSDGHPCRRSVLAADEPCWQHV